MIEDAVRFVREQRVQEAAVQRNNARYNARAQELSLTAGVTGAYLTVLLLGAAGAFAYAGLLALAGTGIAALSLVLSVWAAALIVTGVLFVIAGVLAATGRAQLRRATPPTPEEALGSVRADVEEIRERAHR